MEENTKSIFKSIVKYLICFILLGSVITIALYWGHRNGRIEGLNEGYEKGKTVQVEIQSINSIGKLEVLTADVNLYLADIYGKENETPSGATLYEKQGVAVYSIDLGKLVIVRDETQRKLFISIPESAFSVELFVDETSTEKRDEFIKHSWSESAGIGYSKAMNLDKDSYDLMKKALQDYDGLFLLAIDSGIKQIERLAKASIKDFKAWEVDVFLKKEF